MSHGIFFTVFYQPLYNGLIFLIGHLPWVDAGVAVILFTALVKLAIFPLSRKSIATQMQMKSIEGDMALIKVKYKDNKEEQARQTMKLYRDRKINPFSGFLVVLIQFPIIIALYWVFYKGGLPHINTDVLYSFVPTPETVNMIFLGLVDISKKSVYLALLASVTQYFQIKYSMPTLPPSNGTTPSFKDDFMKSMNIQMRYGMPVIVFFAAYNFSAVIALYWITSNLFGIGQELYMRKHKSAITS
ncbi:MAG: hypothetical protein RLZZ347_549 [Candidatus Parcubacteria bacterium]|jgi:YidC/Oxa1 family membrane protein insertase